MASAYSLLSYFISKAGKAKLPLIAAFFLMVFRAFSEEDENAPPVTWSGGNFMVLCYHDIPARLSEDKYGVDIFSLTKQLEFIRDYGCHFVSAEDIIKASKGEKKLPDKAVLLTFDDAYKSFYESVFPLLKLYGYPCVLAVVSSWIDNPPDDPEYKHGFMTWEQIKELSESGFVEIASHSYDLHKAFQCNPQGNTAPAIITRIYDPAASSYESEGAYAKRLYNDFEMSRKVIWEKTGKYPKVFVWPFGRYTGIAIEEAQKAGFEMMLTLDDGLADINKITAVPRHMLEENPSIDFFVKGFRKTFLNQDRLRIIQADLDLIYDKDPAAQARNLDAFIERIYNIMPSTVFLQAYSDDDADGNIKSVYFPNSVLPMKTDLFNRVSRALSVRGIQVFAWMPMLSIRLPDERENEDLRIKELRDGKTQFPTSWYKNRLSPFRPETAAKLETLYEDLAKNSIIDGIIFQDDGYLNDFEDFSPAASEEYRKITGSGTMPFSKLGNEQKNIWTDLKTDKLIEITERIKKKVLRQRPLVLFARTIYAPVLVKPESEEWFAQNYEKCLRHYDYTVIMAYPKMEDIFFSERWLRSLVRKAKKYPDGLRKTVFKAQAYDWGKDKWISTETVVDWLRVLLAEGAYNVAYYPDDYTVNEPDAKEIRTVISVQDFPAREGQVNGLYP